MVFDNDDDFGVDIFRKDIWESVASKNKVNVGLIKFNEDKGETLQGDFLGVQQNIYSEEVFDIEINLNSYKPNEFKLKKQGFDARGDLRFSCYAKYNIDVRGNDMIVFFDDYSRQFNEGITAGQVFKIEMKDSGVYLGQYCWKEFDIILVRTDGWKYVSQYNTLALAVLVAQVDALTEADYTSESWAVVDTAYNSNERTNPEVLAKIAALTSGIAGLVFAGLAALVAAQQAAAALTEVDYTAESWAVLVLALALPQTDNDEIVAKTTAINNAIAALVLV